MLEIFCGYSKVDNGMKLGLYQTPNGSGGLPCRKGCCDYAKTGFNHSFL